MFYLGTGVDNCKSIKYNLKAYQALQVCTVGS